MAEISLTALRFRPSFPFFDDDVVARVWFAGLSRIVSNNEIIAAHFLREDLSLKNIAAACGHEARAIDGLSTPTVGTPIWPTQSWSVVFACVIPSPIPQRNVRTLLIPPNLEYPAEPKRNLSLVRTNPLRTLRQNPEQ